METTDLDSRFSEYREQLALLEKEDIRTANQSLILDFFCIEERFTEFLRLEVFSDTAARHNTWCHINIRNADSKIALALEDLSLLLDFNKSLDTTLWGRIVSSIAEKQSNVDSLRNIKSILGIGNSDYINKFNKHVEPFNAQKSDVSSDEDRVSIERSSVTSQSVIDVNEDFNKDQQLVGRKPNVAGIVIGSTVGFVTIIGFAGAIITAIYNEASTGTNGYTPSASSDDIAGLTRLESESKNAVLICEMRPIIERANSLSLSEQSSIVRKNELVSEMNKSIAFLDQRSSTGSKYWEDSSCTWGEQWFDKHTDAAFRAFIAVSNKCENPVVHYGITKTGDPADNAFIRKGRVSLGKFDKGEVRLPYLSDNGNYGMIEKVSCG